MYFCHVCILCILTILVISPRMPVEKAYIQPVETNVNTNAMMLKLIGSWSNVFEYSFFGTEIGKLISVSVYVTQQKPHFDN